MVARSLCLAASLGLLSAVPGAADVLGYLAVPDPEATLRHAEAVAEVFAPGQTPPGTLRKTAGAMLGDPSLASLAEGPLLVVFFEPEAPGQPPGFALFVPVKDPAPIGQALTAQGFKTKVAEGLLLAAKTEPALAAAAGVLVTYRSVRDAHPGSDLRLALRASRLVDLYSPVAQAAIESIGSPAAPPQAKPHEQSSPPGPPPEIMKLLRLEAKAFLALAGQVEEARVDLTLAPEAITSETVLVARAGTALAAFATMPAPGPSVTRSLLSGPGAMTASYQLDPVRLSAFVGHVLDEAAKDQDAAELLDPETISWVREFYRSCGSELSMRMTPTPGNPMMLDWAMTATDETRCLEGIEKAAKLMGPGSPLGRAYQSMGIRYEMAFEKGVRRHAGVDVHRMRVRIEGPKAEQMKAFAHDTELAVTHGVYLAAQDPQRLDGLIDRALGNGPDRAPPSEAVRVFGEGQHLYGDYDMIGMLKAMGTAFATRHQPPGGDPFAALPASGEPMTFAGSLADGRISYRSRIPLQPFALMAKAMAKPVPSPKVAPK